VDEVQKRKPLFWPMLFMGAFVLGGILWCLAMWHFANKIREERTDGFFVPMADQTAPATSSSNAPAAPANSGVTNTK
jgi:hypothetical protein